MTKHDVIIIGGGLGGLECGVILSKEGWRVRVLEKHHIAGGCLQSFTRRGRTIDTGMHYIGSMDEGQTLNQYFRYFGILDRLRLRRLDDEAFDVISMGGRDYPFAMGRERFTENLAALFPAERDGLEKYCALIRQTGSTINPETLRNGSISTGSFDYFSHAASGVIASYVKDPLLRNVLAGNSALYDGIEGSTPFYHCATINNSNIEGSYRFAGGTQQLADALTEIIRENGGEVRTNAEVTGIEIDGRRARQVKLSSGEALEAAQIISSLHPAITLGLLTGTSPIRKSQLVRSEQMKNTRGIFSVYLLMKQGKLPYDNRNYYFHGSPDGWDNGYNPQTGHFGSLLMCMQAPLEGNHAEVVHLLAAVPAQDFDRWNNTRTGRRGTDYEQFKARTSDAIIDLATPRYPGLKENIEAVYSSSPLTYRDYTGVPGGSAYGIMKTCNAPMANLVSVRTKIENMLLTGQNINVHGALGVTVTAALTCSELLGMDYLAKKIGNG